MYQSLLPVIKPLIFEGKSGLLEITHKYNDTARLYIKEGIIEQVETKSLKGKAAASLSMQWISFTSTFSEGQPGQYTLDPQIDTMSLLSFLEKTVKNIEIINNHISSDTLIYQVDKEKLGKVSNLNEKDQKMALLFDGKNTIADIVTLAGNAELAVLTRTCRLIIAGVAKEGLPKTLLAADKREEFLDGLNDQLMDMVGPAAIVVIEDGFDTVNSSPETLAKEDIAPLLEAIGQSISDDENNTLKVWGTKFM